MHLFRNIIDDSFDKIADQYQSKCQKISDQKILRLEKRLISHVTKLQNQQYQQIKTEQQLILEQILSKLTPKPDDITVDLRNFKEEFDYQINQIKEEIDVRLQRENSMAKMTDDFQPQNSQKLQNYSTISTNSGSSNIKIDTMIFQQQYQNKQEEVARSEQLALIQKNLNDLFQKNQELRKFIEQSIESQKIQNEKIMNDLNQQKQQDNERFKDIFLDLANFQVNFKALRNEIQGFYEQIDKNTYLVEDYCKDSLIFQQQFTVLDGNFKTLKENIDKKVNILMEINYVQLIEKKKFEEIQNWKKQITLSLQDLKNQFLSHKSTKKFKKTQSYENLQLISKNE